MKISYEFPKYSFVSFVTFLTDYTIYIVAYQLSESIPVSIFVARFFASLVQFWGNKIFVYRDRGGFLKQYFRFLLVVFTSGLVSVLLNKLLIGYMPYYVAKFLAESTIFIVNFLVIRRLVFTSKTKVW